MAGILEANDPQCVGPVFVYFAMHKYCGCCTSLNALDTAVNENHNDLYALPRKEEPANEEDDDEEDDDDSF